MGNDNMFEDYAEFFGDDDVLDVDKKFHENQEFHNWQKSKRRISRNKQRARKVRKIKMLSECGGGMTVWPDGCLDAVTGSFVPSGWLRHSKNSNTQKHLKRISNRKIRNLPFSQTSGKSNTYRKYSEYQWNID